MEIHYIKFFDCLAPKGYNLTTGGGHFQHCELTKQLISKKVKALMLADIDKFRSSEKTKGMPPYIAYTYRIQKGKTYEAYYVNEHPLCKRKYFSVKVYGSLEQAKQACLDFVNNLNATGIPHKILGPGGLPVKGIRKYQGGYQARKTVKGKRTEKNFTQATTDEQNLQDALAFIDSLKRN